MLGIADMQGLWHRSLLVRPDATRDTSTWVAWLQGPTMFADLRLPTGRPSFQGVRGLSDLTGSQVAWLAGQEGFAGRLERDGEFFVWRRALDFQPEALMPDSGRLRSEGDFVIEEGRDTPYVEHWHRQPGVLAPGAVMRLRDQHTGCGGFIVRVGSVFMYARAGPSASLPPGTLLSDCVEGAASLAAAHELVDCEISFGHVTSEGWLIARSSLPYREGARLDSQMSSSAHHCRSADVTPDGRATHRVWEIMELEGDAVGLDALAGRDAPALAAT